MVDCAISFAEKGSVVSNSKIYPGDKVTLVYNGLLAACGADQVWAYLGYGDEWVEKEFVLMEQGHSGFQTVFEVKGFGTLNLCFKDSANNWDNNSGENYKYKISRKLTKSDQPAAKTPRKKNEKATEVKASEKKVRAPRISKKTKIR